MLKINFGCGWEQKLPGWLNVDLNPQANPDVLADLSKDLPFSSESADFIFTEDFFVQLTVAQGKHFLRECRRILKPGGVMRLLTPDLEKFVRTYLEQPEWLVETWDITVGVPLETRSACEVVNLGIRMAGQFHYDKQTFRRVAEECGFDVAEVEYRQSEYPELRGLDIREPERSISMYFQCYPRK
jgi:SAM-dependent methyltransferase